ncbi:MAG: diguanylate cyclase [Desulfobacterales bacterium]
MQYQKFFYFLQNAGRDPAALIFEDEVTGLNNRRYLLQYFKNRVNWAALEQNPLCLLMIDVDYFKRINDQFGHDVGDQAMVHAAEIIKNALPRNAIPVRYAGDNFLVVLPKGQKTEARALARKLLDLVRKNPFSPAEAAAEIPLTVSIGIAAAPEDAADGKTLIHKADTAMYHAKQSGRDRSADAAELVSTDVFPKIALRYLDSAGIAGRKTQLARVSEALKKVAEGTSRLIIADGEPGMGKTSFLATIQENLEKTRLRPIRINGVVQEAFRPYYMAAYIAMGLMNQLPDKGLSVLESLADKEVSRLAQVIPQLKGGSPPASEDDPREREAIFETFTRFLSRLAGKKPLVLLIDDFHFCDPASLHLIRMLMKSEDLLIFVCATASLEEQTAGESVPLELFRNAYTEELDIQDFVLTPLAEADIAKYLRMLFSGLDLPTGLGSEMARVTQGNPLFLVELIRKMIRDGHIFMREEKWCISSPDKDYFPRSLEEIVRDKMEILDEQSRKFLDRASAFGEASFLSMLAGITRDHSARLYDIIKTAEEQGIVHTEFAENDENIRFSSKQVRNIIYDGISPEEKQVLHREIGTYQEKLFEQNLLPSASFLAHHFSRADDPEKAGAWKEFQETRNQLVFDEREIGKSLETTEPEVEEPSPIPGTAEGLAEVALSRRSLELIPFLLRALLVAVRNTRLYPAGSKSVTSAARDLLKLLERIFQGNASVSVTGQQQKIWINGEEVESGTWPALAEKILELLDRLEIKSLVFKQGLTEAELQTLLDEISRTDRKTIPPGFWQSYLQNRELPHIDIRQVVYTEMPSSTAAEKKADSGTETEIPPEIMGLLPDSDTPYPEPHLRKIRRVISHLLGTYSQLKLYPAGGPVARKAVSRLAKELQTYLSENPQLTISRSEYALLVNGIKVDPTGFEALSEAMVKMLTDAGLSSLTFSKEISEDDLFAFFNTLFQTPEQKLNSAFWQEFSSTRSLSGLFFDQRIYRVRQIRPQAALETEAQDLSPDPQQSTDQETWADSPDPAREPEASESVPADRSDDETLARQLRDLFLNDEAERVSVIVEQIAQKFPESGNSGKKAILDTFGAVLSPPQWQPSPAYINLVVKHLIPVFEAAEYGDHVDQGAELLHEAAAELILFGEYPSAARIFTRLQQHSGFGEAAPAKFRNLPHAFGKYLDPRIVDALSSDLKSADKQRRQEAGQLISTMGQGVAPMLVDFIRQEKEIHPRRLAAELLGRLGSPGIEQLKQSLINESRAEEKSRILEVIDSVTTDLVTELKYTLMDPEDPVRHAAFRLARRLERPEVNRLVAELAYSRDTELAVSAIHTLGRRKAQSASGTLSEILTTSSDPDVLIAVCRAMGQIGSPNFVQPLAKILLPRRRLFRRRRYPSRVRIAAAYTVFQIPGEHTEVMIRKLEQDPDDRVREAALFFYS